MKNRKFIIFITILIFVAIVALIVILNKQIEKREQESVPAIDIPLENQPVFGEADAPITVVEFGDYLCPGCKTWNDTIFPQLKKDYIDNGQVKFVYINVLFHGQQSLIASRAAEAVYKQNPDIFWDFHQALFAAQPSSQMHNEPWLTIDKVLEIATTVSGIDVDQLADDMMERAVLEEVDRDNKLVDEHNIQSTPSIFVNGVLIKDPFNYNLIESQIKKGLE